MRQNDNSTHENNASDFSEKVIPNGEAHAYDQGIAIGCKSIIAAVIYNHIRFWIKHNMAEGIHNINGRTWMFQSIPKIQQQLAEFSEKQIKDALTILEEKKLIVKDNFNISKFDKTSWYALTDEKYIIIPKKQFSKNLSDKTYRSDREVLQVPSYNKEEDIQLKDIISPNGDNARAARDAASAAPPPPLKNNSLIEEKASPEEKISVTIDDPSDDEVKRNIHRVEYPLRDWKKLVEKYGEERVRQASKKMQASAIRNGKKIKSPYRACMDWINNNWDLPREEKRPEKKRYGFEYEGAGSLPLTHITEVY